MFFIRTLHKYVGLFLAPRSYGQTRNFAPGPAGIRSLSFNGDILTIGTGTAVLMFYDLRAQKYLDSGVSSGRAVVLKATAGWMVSGQIGSWCSSWGDGRNVRVGLTKARYW